MAVTVMIDRHINNQAAEQQLDLQSMQRSHFQDSIKYYGPDLIFSLIPRYQAASAASIKSVSLIIQTTNLFFKTYTTSKSS